MPVSRRRQIKETPQTLEPVRPNVGVRVSYRKKIEALIDEVAKSAEWWLVAAYRRNESDIVGDANTITAKPSKKTPAKNLRLEYQRWQKRVKKTINTKSDIIASWFTNKTRRIVQVSLKKGLGTAGIKVRFDKDSIPKDVLESIVYENAQTIRSLADSYVDDLALIIQRSVQNSGDLEEMADELHERYKITRRKARLIARDQNNKATTQIHKAQDISLGITEGIWRHVPGEKYSRRTHEKLDGQRFKLNEGLYDPDVKRKIMPSELIYCNCIYVPVIPDAIKARESDEKE